MCVWQMRIEFAHIAADGEVWHPSFGIRTSVIALDIGAWSLVISLFLPDLHQFLGAPVADAVVGEDLFGGLHDLGALEDERGA